MRQKNTAPRGGIAKYTREHTTGSEAVQKRLPQFSIEELATLQYYCWKYSRFVRGGGTPTVQQDARFMAFQAVTYEEGVAYVQP